MSYFIPTLNQCKDVCKKNKKFNMYSTVIHGVDVINFSSSNTTFDIDFEIPYKKCKHEIYEFEGLCFVDNIPHLMVRHPILKNRMIDSWTNDYKDIDIKYMQRISGNPLIRFIKIKDKVYAKDIKGFDSIICEYANRLYNNTPNLKCFVDWTLDNNKVAIFEFDNGLSLSGMRDNITGYYEPFALWNDCDYWDVTKIKQYRHFILEDIFLDIHRTSNWLIYLENNELLYVT